MSYGLQPLSIGFLNSRCNSAFKSYRGHEQPGPLTVGREPYLDYVALRRQHYVTAWATENTYC